MTVDEAVQRALACQQAGKLQEAEQLCRTALAHQSNHPGALQVLGLVAIGVGNFAAAADLIAKSLAVRGDAAGYYNLGVALNQLGRYPEAISAYQASIAASPEYSDAHNNLGVLLAQLNRTEEAESAYRKAIQYRPENAEAHNNLANLLRRLGRTNDAIAEYRQAVALNPTFSQALSNLGNMMSEGDKPAEAIEYYRRAIAVRPDFAQAYYNLGNALGKQDEFDAAEAAYKKAISLKPDFAPTYNNLGNLYRETGRVEEAVELIRTAARMMQTDSIESNLLFTMLCQPEYDPNKIFQDHRQWGQRHAPPRPDRPFENDRAPDRRLKIGYVSPDFRVHSVAFFMARIFENHDSARFHITCYMNSTEADAVTEQFRKCADEWVDIFRQDDQTVADRIRADRIDILVDLSGHTAGGRLIVFARKPAPIQVTYLGYAATTGLSALDWRLTDAAADPPGAEENYTEKLLRLPRTAWCFAPLSGFPPIEKRDDGPIVFASFNNMAKINRRMVETWRRILTQVPGSRLLIKNRAGACPAARDRLARELPGIELIGFLKQDHLRSYNPVDIALDTFPYHGTTTTCEALWMGVPVITRAGGAHISRVGVSLLTSVGCPELIAHDEDEYIKIAVNLAHNRPRLAELRQTLRDRMKASPLMDGPGFTRELEAAYRQMWLQWINP